MGSCLPPSSFSRHHNGCCLREPAQEAEGNCVNKISTALSCLLPFFHSFHVVNLPNVFIPTSHLTCSVTPLWRPSALPLRRSVPRRLLPPRRPSSNVLNSTLRSTAIRLANKTVLLRCCPMNTRIGQKPTYKLGFHVAVCFSFHRCFVLSNLRSILMAKVV